MIWWNSSWLRKPIKNNWFALNKITEDCWEDIYYIFTVLSPHVIDALLTWQKRQLLWNTPKHHQQLSSYSVCRTRCQLHYVSLHPIKKKDKNNSYFHILSVLYNICLISCLMIQTWSKLHVKRGKCESHFSVAWCMIHRTNCSFYIA